MVQKSMSIYEFKRGDLITRIEPSKPLPGFDGEDFKDRAYIGTPLKFLGIANGCVYVERYKKPNHQEGEDELPIIGSFFKMMVGEAGPINLPLDIWSDGWSYYIDPYTLSRELDDKFQDLADDEPHASLEELERQLKEALKREDYLRADKLQKMINNLK